MEIIKTKNITSEQFRQIDQLWNGEYPMKLNDRFKLLLEGVQSYTHYLIEADGKILAWAVEFKKDEEIRFSIIVDGKQQRKGLGKMLLERLKADLDEFYGWVIDHNEDVKIDGTNYQSPINFYLKNGLAIVPNEKIDSEMIKAIKVRYKATS